MTDEALSFNLRRGYQPLRSRDPRIAAQAEAARARLIADVDDYIARLRATDPAAASDAEQQAKILRTKGNASWWNARSNYSARSILRCL